MIFYGCIDDIEEGILGFWRDTGAGLREKLKKLFRVDLYWNTLPQRASDECDYKHKKEERQCKF